MKKINILGINVSLLEKKEILKRIENFLTSKDQFYLVTPNPEIILKAIEDEELFYILNKADLAPADGVGIKLAGFLQGKNIKRFPGADLVLEILKIAQGKKIKVLIANSQSGLSQASEIENNLKKRFPDLNLKAVDLDISSSVDWSKKIKNFNPQILFASFGSPVQEKFIYHNFKKIPGLKLAAGVGGSFDFLTGKLSRAPKILRFLGLEWAWRFYKQPRRAKRIFRAIIIFPLKYLIWRFLLPWFYRSNVACLLYKKEKKGYKVLLVERKDEPGHWQLPQGGTEGENLLQAGTRELSEELNCHNFYPVTTFGKTKKYKFDKKDRKNISKKHWGYKGQKQGLFIAEFTGKDDDIEINYWEHRNWKWVDWKNLKKEIHPIRRKNLEKFLEIFKKEVLNKDFKK